MNINLKKALSILIPLAGAGLSLATSWMDDKNLDEKVAEAVSKALAEQAKES